MKLRKWKALLLKDFRLTLNNRSLLAVMLLPVLFAVIYTQMFGKASESMSPFMILILVTTMGMMMIGSASVGTSIAEEKEKKTLRSLMLSNVSGVEFLISKLIVIAIFNTLIMALSYLIVGTEITYLPTYMFLIFLTSISLMFISSVIGLYAPNQQAVGLIGMPIMFASFAPMFAMLGGNKGVLYFISKLLPTGPITFILAHKVDMFTDYSTILGIVTMVVWIGLALGGFVIAYGHKKFDN